ncbi:MAG: DNA methyltransferase [Cytophagales bacterium]|nr:MAG: DNA methyltransferase [Cytophagales bacterium]
MTIEQYIDNINAKYKLGNATEHTFRGLLEQLLETIAPEIRATNEPKRQQCGAPDYILTKKEIPIGFIEAKDIGDKDLLGVKKTGNKEQFDRYKNALNNLIFTDYIDFHLYIDGILVTKIAIAEVKNGTIAALPNNFASFTNFIKDFCSTVSQTIKSPQKLAQMMAGKARLLSDVIELSLISDEDNRQDSTLKEQMNAFREILIHDITPKGFADVYAQTIAYGMFAARLHDPTLPTFSRQEASELIPKSNPFLRKLFSYIAGPDVDDRIKWIVDSLVEVFLACNVEEILKNYSPHQTSTKEGEQGEDPIIHFYETFLSEYDPELRKARGVWYTPKPVVNFIIRAVDDILKTEFDLQQGLADNTKTKIKINEKGKMLEKEVHKVQILDPATGTGTFLAEVIKHIHAKFKGQQGVWSNYVETHLLPRLSGFELLMASYAMAHLQIDLLLTKTGFKLTKDQRFRIYLTNSLEKSHPDTATLFANWLSNEANEANFVKRDTPVMCIVGNPPYSGESKNKGEWIMQLMEDYKKEPGGKEKLKEQNPKWINDDYVKFLRYGQHYIERNGSGVLAFINPHGFLDNPTFRGMRWNLLKTYDKIYIIDLHGNAKKKEVSPDGSVDVNVFDIMQGVAISIFVKTGKKKTTELGKVFHYDLFGKRDFKYDFLLENTLKSIDFVELPNVAPDYFFVSKDFNQKIFYDKGFAVNDLFDINGVGITTAHDEFVIQENKNSLLEFYQKFQKSPRDTDFLHKDFNVAKKIGWNILQGYDNIKNEKDLSKYIQIISYRPFDNRYVFYEDRLVWRTAKKVMQHFTKGQNIGLTLCKQFKTGNNYFHAFITNEIIESSYVSNRTSEITSVFPLYLYPITQTEQHEEIHNLEAKLEEAQILLENFSKAFEQVKKIYQVIPNPTNELKAYYEEQIKHLAKLTSNVDKFKQQVKSFSTNSLFDDETRTPNLNTEIIKRIAKELNLKFTNEKETTKGTFAPIDIFDYIYAVLHSPNYREKYTAFLKIDFPKIPYPKNTKIFWELVELGSQIREIHLLESSKVEDYITEFNIDGDCVVEKSIFKDGKVFINETQYFENVPETAWEFYIGGYQPAQKWLKDRKSKKLEFDEIAHYQKIIVALSKTDKLMQKINEIEVQ